MTAAEFQSVGGGPVRLTKKALRRFLAEYHRRCETVLTVDGRCRTYREWIDAQSKSLALSLRAGGRPFQGFVVQ